MKRPRVLALVLAGGEGGRLAPLTNERAKPALPFAGVYRLIDFPLSNCLHSGIVDVWVIQQYEPHELEEQLAHGRPWDLDRTRGGLRILHPYLGDSESGWYEGNADAIYRNRAVIAAHDPDARRVSLGSASAVQAAADPGLCALGDMPPRARPPDADWRSYRRGTCLER